MTWQEKLATARQFNADGNTDRAKELFVEAQSMKESDNLDSDMAEFETGVKKAANIDELSARLEELERSPAHSPDVAVAGTKSAPVLKGARGDNEVNAWGAFYKSGDDGGIKHLQSGTSNTGAGQYTLKAADAVKASNDTTMNITTDADGGYAVPTGHYNGIITRLDEQALYNRLGVQMITGVGTTVNVPIDSEADGEFIATAESAAADRDAPALGTVAMTLAKYTKKVDMTDELLQDEESNIMAYLERRVAIGLAKTHNNLLVTTALADGTAGLTLDAAAAIDEPEIPEFAYLLKEEYAANGSWLMNRATEGYLRGLQGTDFVFSDRPAGSARTTPNEILGFPVYTSSKMTYLAASVKSLVFGDFGYVGLRMAPELTVLRDPYTRAVNGEILFVYTTRLIYKVLIAEAIQYATHPSA